MTNIRLTMNSLYRIPNCACVRNHFHEKNPSSSKM